MKQIILHNPPGTGFGYGKVLQNRRYRLLWLGQLVSSFGDSLHRITLLWLVTERTGSALGTGSIIIAATLPVLLFSLPGGVFADRYNRRYLMITADLVRAGLVLLIPLFAHFNLLGIYFLFIITFLMAAISQVYYPAETAIIPNLVNQEDLSVANALSFASRVFMNIIGPTISGALVALLGPLVAFYLDSATFVFSAACIGAISVRVSTGFTAQFSRRSFVEEAMEGIQFIVNSFLVRSVVGLGILATFAFGPFLPMAPLYVQQVLGAGAAEYGLLSSAAALGLFLGTLLTGRIAGQLGKGWLLIIGYMGMGGTTLLFAISPSINLALVWNLLRSGFNAPIVIAFTTLLQQEVPDDKRGKVIGTAGMLPEVSRPMGIALGSLLADGIGLRAVLGMTGVIFLVCSFIGISVRDLRRVK